MTFRFPLRALHRRGALGAAGLLMLTGACDINKPDGSLFDWGVNLAVVAFEVDGILYRAQDREGVNLPEGEEDKSRFRVPMGDRGQWSLYCDTIDECRILVRRSRYHQDRINPPQPPATKAPPPEPEESTRGD